MALAVYQAWATDGNAWQPLAARLKLLEEKVTSFDGKLDRLITLAGLVCVGLMLAGLVATVLGLAY